MSLQRVQCGHQRQESSIGYISRNYELRLVERQMAQWFHPCLIVVGRNDRSTNSTDFQTQEQTVRSRFPMVRCTLVLCLCLPTDCTQRIAHLLSTIAFPLPRWSRMMLSSRTVCMFTKRNVDNERELTTLDSKCKCNKLLQMKVSYRIARNSTSLYTWAVIGLCIKFRNGECQLIRRQMEDQTVDQST